MSEPGEVPPGRARAASPAGRAPVRPAVPGDAETLARIHVASWREAYAGLLPSVEIAARGLADRRRLWTRVLAGDQHVVVSPGLGFAQVAGQREAALADRGYSHELWCLYVLARAHGSGLARRLLCAALPGAVPFTACVIDGNARALAFYRKTGAELLETRADRVGATPVTEHVLGWDGAAVAKLLDSA